MWQQRAMSIVLQGCKNVVYYIDDILVTGAGHEANLRHVFQSMIHIRVNLEKCKIFEKIVKFLGHHISPEGIRPTEERVRGILEAPILQNKSELKSFIGLMFYNSKFLPSLAKILHALYKLLRKESKSWQSSLLEI